MNNKNVNAEHNHGLQGYAGIRDFMQEERIRNAEAKRIRLASEASDYAIQEMAGTIDWGRFSYEKHNTCTKCNGPLKLISKRKDSQRFICKTCGTKYELINHAKGSPKAWDLTANVMEIPSNVSHKGNSMYISAF